MVRRLALLLQLALTLAAWGPVHAQRIIAHRGASHDAPENTLAAFQLAWQQGADGIEADFHLTRDGQVVCIHDATTKRTAGVERVVAESTLDELSGLDVGSWKDPRFADQRIPTLDQVLDTVPGGKLFYVELKVGPEIVPKVREELARSDISQQQLVIISFDADVVAAAKREMPEVRAHWLTSYKKPGPDDPPGPIRPTFEEILRTLATTRADGLGTQADRDVVTQPFIQGQRERGMREFHVWTVNDAESARYFQSLQPYSITTDRPRDLRRWLESS